jgi:hypothetical protein
MWVPEMLLQQGWLECQLCAHLGMEAARSAGSTSATATFDNAEGGMSSYCCAKARALSPALASETPAGAATGSEGGRAGSGRMVGRRACLSQHDSEAGPAATASGGWG